MLFKKFVKKFLVISAILGVFAGLTFYFIAPFLVEKIVIQRVSKMPGLDGFSFDVEHIGLNRLELGSITTGSTLRIERLSLGYSMAALLKGHIKSVKVSGLDLMVRVASQGVVFTDFSQLMTDKNSSDSSSGTPSMEESIDEMVKTFFPMIPETVQVKNSAVTILMDRETFRIPMEILLGLKDRANLTLETTVFPLGETLEAKVTAGKETGIETVEVKADAFAFSRIQDLVDQVAPKVTLKGRSDFFLTRAGQGDWKINLSGLTIATPINLSLKDLRCTIPSLSLASFSGSFLVESLPDSKINVDLGSGLGVDFEGGLDSFLNWRLKASLANQGTLRLSQGEEPLEIIKPSAAITLKGRGNLGSVNLAGKIDECKIENGSVSKIILDARGNFNLEGKQDVFDMGFTAACGPISLKTKDYFVQIPDATIPGRLVVDSNFAPKINLTPSIKGARASSKVGKVEARDISFNLPVYLPLDNPGKKNGPGGNFSVSALVHRGEKIGTLRGTIDQVNRGFETRAMVDVNASTAEVDLSFSAEALATLTLGEKRTKCAFDMTLTKGRVAGTDSETGKDLLINGITARIVSDDLFTMQTRPGQLLKIDSIRGAKIVVTDLSLAYTVESLNSFLVEKIGFAWCGGRVTTESMRIEPQKDEYSLTLFCDRLKLSEILRQLGSFQAKGDGALNGRIPISFSKGNFSFDRGFLFSTPGGGGKISVRGAETLLSGIPKGSAEYSQIDLAREALKDYEYKWAKLLFNTTGESLVVNMSFDGEPENPLPFVYKKEFGGFARVDASSPGSKFQGIRIDVNLELPFNRVMKFGSKLNSLMQ